MSFIGDEILDFNLLKEDLVYIIVREYYYEDPEVAAEQSLEIEMFDLLDNGIYHFVPKYTVVREQGSQIPRWVGYLDLTETERIPVIKTASDYYQMLNPSQSHIRLHLPIPQVVYYRVFCWKHSDVLDIENIETVLPNVVFLPVGTHANVLASIQQCERDIQELEETITGLKDCSDFTKAKFPGNHTTRVLQAAIEESTIPQRIQQLEDDLKIVQYTREVNQYFLERFTDTVGDMGNLAYCPSADAPAGDHGAGADATAGDHDASAGADGSEAKRPKIDGGSKTRNRRKSKRKSKQKR